MTSLRKLNGWQRLWMLIAIVWAIPVSVFTFMSLPKDSESQIKAQWADEKVDLLRKYHGQGQPLDEYRSRMYGNASNDEIIHPKHVGSQQFDPSTAVPVDESAAIDQKYESRLAQVANESLLKTAGLGFVVWVLPLIAIYLFGIGAHWVYRGFRNSP